MTDGSVLAVGAAGDPGGVFAALSAAYTVHAEPAESLRWTWLDTADWRLHRAGLALREQRSARGRELVLDSAGAAHLTAAVRGIAWPARLDRLADSPLRDRLAGVVGVRALLPVAEVEVKHIMLRLMDGVAKTRVRVSLEQQRLVTPRRAALPLHIVVRALRGYDDDARRCVQLLSDAMDAEDTSPSPTDAALAAAGHLLPPAATALETLDPAEPAVRPVAQSLLTLLRSVDDAREGALADHDTEFLHDLRLAIRSTRALLGAVGELLPGRSALRVERDLHWLDDSTAAMRAVDLALLEVGGDGDLDLDHLAGFVDPHVLDPLRAQLQRRRRTELRRMRQTLRSPRAPAAFTAWRDDLQRMLDADLIGLSTAEAAHAVTERVYDTLTATPAHDAAPPLAELREVLRTFAPLHATTAGADDAARLRADVEQAHQLVRRRDGLRSTGTQVRAAVEAATLPAAAPAAALPAATVLAAGALLDRAAQREHELDSDLAARLAALTSRRSGKRIATVVAALPAPEVSGTRERLETRGARPA